MAKRKFFLHTLKEVFKISNTRAKESSKCQRVKERTERRSPVKIFGTKIKPTGDKICRIEILPNFPLNDKLGKKFKTIS